MRQLKEADITINGRSLSQAQSRHLRNALQFARRDMECLPNDLVAAVMLDGINRLLELIDETEITL